MARLVSDETTMIESVSPLRHPMTAAITYKIDLLKTDRCKQWRIRALRSLLLFINVLAASYVAAAERLDEFAEIRMGLAAAGLPLVDVSSSPVPGLYEVKLTDGTILLTDPTGTYFVVGDVYQLSLIHI